MHPYLQSAGGPRGGTYPHPSLEPCSAHARRAAVSGTAAEDGDGRRGLSGGEAEELRRAMGFKRSDERMEAIEARLRAGWRSNGIAGAAAEQS